MTLREKIEIDYGQPMTYTLVQLETKSMTFLNESKRYKNMSVKDKKELAALKARAAERLAKNLISPDTSDFVAWPRAIREKVLEVHSD
jgi:hypothetical protein